MDEEQWLTEWYDRPDRYAGRRLDPATRVVVSADEAYLRSVEGQAGVLTAAALLSRMTPSVVLALPDIEILPALPWAGRSILDVALTSMRAANPHGHYSTGDIEGGDFRFHLGPQGAKHVVHGAGWNAYIGPSPSPLPPATEPNTVGAALAVTLAAAHLFRSPFRPFEEGTICNAFDWRSDALSSAPAYRRKVSVGHVLAAGLGSVGSTALYFLAMATRNFNATLLDMDIVKVKNITRSPIFSAEDARLRTPKVASVESFLRGAGVHGVVTDAVALHHSRYWTERESGTPDVLIPAANELNVRYQIEMRYPPIQIYATTGKNWQTTLFRHVPGDVACSLCMFPPSLVSAPTACASDDRLLPDTPEQIDAALPFLSFAAGLMTATEILKLSISHYQIGRSKVALYTQGKPMLVHTPVIHRPGCTCESRSHAVHERMVRGSRYSDRSRFRMHV